MNYEYIQKFPTDWNKDKFKYIPVSFRKWEHSEEKRVRTSFQTCVFTFSFPKFNAQ
jgi:hypothetical protein